MQKAKRMVLDRQYEESLRNRFDKCKVRLREEDEGVWELSEPCCLCKKFKKGVSCTKCPFVGFENEHFASGCLVWLRERGYNHPAVLTACEGRVRLEERCREITEIMDKYVEFR